jgi:hypothetical protein
MSPIDAILGYPIASNEAGEQRISSAAGVPTFGLDAPQFRLLRPRGGVDRTAATRCLWIDAHLSDHCCDRRSARYRLRKLPPDHYCLPDRERLLYSCAREPRPEGRASSRQRSDDGLCELNVAVVISAGVGALISPFHWWKSQERGALAGMVANEPDAWHSPHASGDSYRKVHGRRLDRGAAVRG